MYPLDQQDLVEDDIVEFFRYYLSLNEDYLKLLGKEEKFMSFLRDNSKTIIKEVNACKTAEAFYAIVAKVEKNLPYKSEITEKETLADKCEYLHKNIAMAKFNKNGEVDCSRKGVLKLQRALDDMYENLFDVTKKYKNNVDKCKELMNAMRSESTLLAFYKGVQKAVSLTEFKEMFTKSCQSATEKLKEVRKNAFEQLKAYNIGFYQNIYAQQLAAKQEQEATKKSAFAY